MPAIDILAAFVVGVALLRGFYIGLVREAFSLGGIAAAAMAANFFATPLGDWLVAATDGGIPEIVAPWLGGGISAVAAVALVTAVGRAARRGVQAVGFSWADRTGGALLGATEGALIVCVIVAASLALLQRLRQEMPRAMG